MKRNNKSGHKPQEKKVVNKQTPKELKIDIQPIHENKTNQDKRNQETKQDMQSTEAQKKQILKPDQQLHGYKVGNEQTTEEFKLEHLKKFDVDAVDLNSEEAFEKAKKLASKFDENSCEADMDEIATFLMITLAKKMQEKFGSDYDFEFYGK